MGLPILVTGGAGFIGASVVRALEERGDAVIVLDSGVAAGMANLAGTRAQIIQADIRQRDAVAGAVAGCVAIVHLAAQAGVEPSIADPLANAAVNVDGTLGLLDAARVAGVRRFVFGSSNAVVAGHPPPAREDQPPNPVSPYGAAKAAAEAYLRAYSRAFAMECAALRFSNAYGEWSAHKTSVVASFTRSYLAGGPLIVRGGGQQTRDFVHVSDVTAAILACLDAPAQALAGGIFQIGTGTETSLLELAGLLFEVAGAEMPIEHQPAAAGDVPRNFSDIAKAQRVLGYGPRVALRAGLSRTLAWFRDQRRG